MPLEIHHAHAWNLKAEEAIEVQKKLRSLVKYESPIEEIHRIGGVDVGFRGEKAHAAVAVLSYPSLKPVEMVTAEVDLTFPYVPGLLSFREMPAILAALEKVNLFPDLFMVDGQGIAHPRRFGIASHLGVLLDKPSIGCAKSVLVGKYGALGDSVGSMAELRDAGEVIGVALCTRVKCKPLIISVGHRMDLPGAIKLVMTCTRGYRLPEPTRLAHNLASRKDQPSPDSEMLFGEN